ncbi:MAG: class I SAM-dependent methyltransferase [Terriglobia bacterium]
MSEFDLKAFERYGDLRPGRRVLSAPAALLSGIEPVFRKLFTPYLPVEKDARILDVGSGYGEFLYFLQRQGYERAAGVDLDPKQVEIGRSLGVRNLTCGDARELLRESSRQLDFISAIDVLEHFRKDKALDLLKLIYAALRPGGRFLCQVPNAATFYLPLFYMDFTHETPFAPSSLKQALEMAGFANVRVSGMGPVVHGVKSAVRSVLWNLIEAGLRFVQTVEAGPGDDLRRIFTATIFAVADRP